MKLAGLVLSALAAVMVGWVMLFGSSSHLWVLAVAMLMAFRSGQLLWSTTNSNSRRTLA